MNKKNVNKRKRYYFICSILTSIVFLAIGAYTIYAAIPSPGHGTSDLEGDASLNMNSNKIINLSTPTAGTDAATKAYVDAAGSSVAYRFLAQPASPACPVVPGVTCRAKLCAQLIGSNYMLYPHTCDYDVLCTHSAICYYSSL